GRIFDSDGSSADYSTVVTVNEVPPTATFGNNGPVNEASPVTVSFTNPFSPSQADTQAGFHHSFALSTAGLATSYASAGTASSAPFTFAEDGTYTVYGRIFDSDGSSADYSTVVTVNEVPPTATFGNDGPVNEASPVTVSFTNPFSPSQADTQAGFHHSFALSTAGLATGYAAAGTASSAPFTFAEDGTYTVYGRIFDSDGSSTDYSTVVTVNEVPPTATFGNNGPVNEASPVTVSFTNPFSPSQADTQAGFHYSFALSTAGLATSYAAAGTASSAPFTFATEGKYTVYGRIFDSDGSSTGYSTVVTVNEALPTASVSGSTPSVRGQPETFTFSASDPAPVGQPPAFTYLVNWGDGSPQQTMPGGSTLQLIHTYTADGAYQVRVQATDGDGAQGPPSSALTITVATAAMQGSTLVVGGTTATDTILLAPVDLNGNVKVTINGASAGTFHPTTEIVVYAQAGNDQVQLQSARIHGTTAYISVPAALFGGNGNDVLDARGSTANDILVGGPGNDTLWGGRGRNLLIGGLGSDTLHAGSADDILIGGTTQYDNNLAALNAIMSEWGRTDLSYQARINDLSGPSGGLNGSYFLNSTTVHDDGAVDYLYGGSGQDWFFYHASQPNADVVKNKRSNEVATII
ncbi:MAG TPA: PKD domain-containing protein, partial [Pirellulales bacterium]|nr:PKD domain-containing protein [Pirellulales bacterium]